MLKYKDKHILFPKEGNNKNECEDAYQKHTASNNKSFFCISDGATESSFAKEWANILVNGITDKKHLSCKKFIEMLPRLREEWRSTINVKDLPWYAEEKVSQGAFATLLALNIDLKNNSLCILAVGDCCLFLIRENQLIFQFPSGIDFSSNPYLISTNPLKNKDLEGNIKKQANYKIQKNDLIFIMSDAIAHWFLREIEQQKEPWHILKSTFDRNCFKEDFEKWLSELRIEKKIKNDDTTIVQLYFE